MLKKQICFAALILFSLSILLLTACGEGAKKEFSSPKQTVTTYLGEVSILKVSIDPMAYGRALNCFAKPAREWFKNNHESLVKNPEEMDGLGQSQREAFSFVVNVMPKGPTSAGKIEEIKKEKDNATLSVDGMKIEFIREGKNWRMKSLFGVNGN